MMRRLALMVVGFTLLGAAGPTTVKPFTLTSPAFRNGQVIPAVYACDGSDENPPFVISGTPKKTKSLALVIDDPDAVPVIGHVADHWVLWNIPATTTAIATHSIPKGAAQGMSYDAQRYEGPCPPTGQTHRYYFRLYALNIPKLKLAAGTSAVKLRAAMRGHVLKEATLMGTYTAKDAM